MGAEVWHLLLFFFFKQKTAYEMRISDWSSDVLLFRSPWTGVMRCGVSDGAAVSMPHLLHASSTAAHGLRDARSNLLPLLKMWSRTSYMDNARSGRASAILECVTPTPSTIYTAPAPPPSKASSRRRIAVSSSNPLPIT